MQSVADPRGGGAPCYGPKFSQFNPVFGKIWQICMLASPPRSYGESWIRPWQYYQGDQHGRSHVNWQTWFLSTITCNFCFSLLFSSSTINFKIWMRKYQKLCFFQLEWSLSVHMRSAALIPWLSSLFSSCQQAFVSHVFRSSTQGRSEASCEHSLLKRHCKMIQSKDTD